MPNPNGTRAIHLDRFDDIADKGEILPAAESKARSLVAAPRDAIGGVLDIGEMATNARSTRTKP